MRKAPRTVLQALEITKTFGATRALDRATLALRAGEVHALIGENGAGKSTLVKIVSGALRPDSGTLRLGDSDVEIRNPRHALRLGISIVHQHSGLVSSLTVAENIFLGRMPETRLGLVDWRALHDAAAAALERLDFRLDPHLTARELDAASQQVVEIARALSISASVLILDEPSAVLGAGDLERLFEILRRLREQGKAIVYVSHRLSEVLQISDRATVLRDGRNVGTFALDGLVDESHLVRKMAGPGWEGRPQGPPSSVGRELLRVEDLSRHGALNKVSFALHAGEILGIAGLVGSGRTELCKSIFGALKPDSGRIRIEGRLVQFRGPADGVRHGIAYLPADRHGESLVLCHPLGWNITFPILRRLATWGILSRSQEYRAVNSLMGRLEIRAGHHAQLAATLSGGNQQKVALAKWLSTEARIFLLVEPTAGIDVAAKDEIHAIVSQLARSGAGILLVSSEIPELLSLANRVLVLNKGHVAGQLEPEASTEHDVLTLAT